MADPINVLLVDDWVENLNALEAMLESTGARLVRAQSAEEALLALVRDDFAAIVLDIRLPGMDGLELAKLIKRRRRTRHIPILFLTAHLLEEQDALRGYDIGAVDYLSKPINPDILRSKIGVFIELYAKTRVLEAESAERRRVASQLREANEELEARVEERTHEVVTASQAARESEERLHQALAAARAGVWEFDFARNESRWSPEMFDLHGLAPGETGPSLEGFMRWLHPEDLARIREATARAMEHGGPFEMEFRVLRPDGRENWIASSGTIELSPEGIPASARGVNQDVTARRQAEAAMRESEARLRIANDVAGMGTYVADLERGRIRYGPSLCLMLGLPQDAEMELPEGFRFVHAEDRPRLVAALEASVDPAAEGRVHLELRLVRSNGEVFWCSYNAQLEFRNEAHRRTAIRQVGAIFDITDRKHAEEALRDADRRKDEFLATLAHELRNPLAPLRFGLEALRLSDGERDEQERIHAMMERQVDHMVRLVDDLLEVSRITSGKIELRKERVEAATVVQSAIEATLPLIEAAHLNLDLQIPAEAFELEADPVRLVQVFANLLNNAVKFTGEGGKISVGLRREEDELITSVRDTGIGISSEMLPRIFDSFAQADRLTGAPQSGLGIGLFLARGLVQLHGGRIEAISSGPGTGSEFRVRLPLARNRWVRPKARQHGEDPSRQLRGRRILVVDDNRDTADSLAAMLRMLGVEARAVHSGAAALNTLGEWKPDTVLLDIGMPDMNGHEVARRIRTLPGCEDLTLIAITGWGQAEDRRRSAEAGFDHHLVKPVGADVLKELLAGANTSYRQSE